ncbi:MAG: Fe-S-containing protein [Acidobacteriota bacterium]
MKHFKPVYGLVVVVLFVGVVISADLAMTGASHQRVSPDSRGLVEIDVADLGTSDVRFYRFLNSGNQEVKFFVGRDREGTLHVAFDASETDYKRKRGFRHEGDWMVNNKCDTAVLLAKVNASDGGCHPVPLAHRSQGDRLVLHESDILAGWRYFR